MKMGSMLPLFVFITISSRLTFGSAQENLLREGLRGSRDFAYEGPINDGTLQIVEKPTTTTVSPKFRECVDACLTTATVTDDRPVCGSDHVTYKNSEHFYCAVQCGKLGINKLYTDKCNDLF